MAGVYGNPITNETLEGLPEYDGKTIEAIDRARVALKWINTEAKDAKALQFLKEELQSNPWACAALCLVYNATGDTVVYADKYSVWGCLTSTPYPSIIQNGQWGAFIIGAADGSKQAFVFRGSTADWMFALMAQKEGKNVAYTEINNKGYFYNNWKSADTAFSLKEDQPTYNSEWSDYSSFSSIGLAASFPIFRAILTLKNAY